LIWRIKREAGIFGNQDHPINVVELKVERNSVSEKTVNFPVTCNLGDENQNDRYEGSVSVTVIGDLA
jgi:hypothetical protein